MEPQEMQEGPKDQEPQATGGTITIQFHAPGSIHADINISDCEFMQLWAIADWLKIKAEESYMANEYQAAQQAGKIVKARTLDHLGPRRLKQ